MKSVFRATVGLTALVALAGCGSSSSGGSPSSTPPASSPAASATAPADPAGATAAITSTWTAFFHTGTPRAQALQLLEDGSQLGGAIKFAAKLQRQQKVTESAKVNGVVFTSPTTATVSYELDSHGQPLLPNATGQAVLVNGKWLVSKATFCTLVQLGAAGKTVPGC